MKTKKNILVTRILESDSLIRKWSIENGIRLLEKSFIETVPVTGLSIPETDWIFFSSPQGVKLYFDAYELKAKKVAALSAGTAAAVLKAGHAVLFTGDGTKSTKEIGAEFFAKMDPNESVLFPLSDISKRNISTQKGKQNVIERITYKTELCPLQLDEIPDVILFTSPSNVDGFLLKNAIDTHSVVLAIGETTGLHLKSSGINKIQISHSTHEGALLSKIQNVLKD